jgi:4-amino-4-deoxy-L-arabinose transferase-like glycosyltransferase
MTALRTAARIALVAGAAGSLALMFHAGRRNPSIILMGMFTIWVLSPFVGLALADLRSTRWPVPGRTTLHVVTIVLALGSLVVFGVDSVRPFSPHTAFLYLVVPPATWLIATMAIALAAMTARRRNAG